MADLYIQDIYSFLCLSFLCGGAGFLCGSVRARSVERGLSNGAEHAWTPLDQGGCRWTCVSCCGPGSSRVDSLTLSVSALLFTELHREYNP